MPKPGFKSITVPASVYDALAAELRAHNKDRIWRVSMAEFVCSKLGFETISHMKRLGIEVPPIAPLGSRQGHGRTSTGYLGKAGGK